MAVNQLIKENLLIKCNLIMTETLNKSWEIWKFLKLNAGLDDKYYDISLVAELKRNLCLDFNKDIIKELKLHNVSVERFVYAFLKAIEPYSLMMKEIYSFFYLHGVKGSNNKMRIEYDFGNGIEKLDFDLKHFKDSILKINKLWNYYIVYNLNVDSLWGIHRILQRYDDIVINDLKVTSWIDMNEKNRTLSEIPQYNIPKITNNIDPLLNTVWNIWSGVVEECLKYGKSYEDLRKVESNIQSSELSDNFLEVTYKKLDLKTLISITSDRWPTSVLRRLAGFFQIIKKDSLNKEVKETIDELQSFIDGIPNSKIKKSKLIREFIDIINLPFWKKRYELYQTWILALLDTTLSDYKRTIHHKGGRLVMKFSGTHVSTVETINGNFLIWSELKSPLKNPVGKGRKANIQPDYSIASEPVSEIDNTVLAIECKQYKVPKNRTFSEAITDYAAGRPKAKIILVNYGPIQQNLFQYLNKGVRKRSTAIGNLRPNQSKNIAMFKEAILESLPLPILVSKDFLGIKNLDEIDQIIVDISSSMESILIESNVENLLNKLSIFYPNAKLLAVDVLIRYEGDNFNSNIQSVLKLDKKSNTNLTSALYNRDLTKSIIITDEDGKNQLVENDMMSRLIIEIITAKKMTFHFK